jgi:hypothetical protein
MFVPDLLHEFELGVWKAVFTHLLRILHACGGDKIQTLNSRYAPSRISTIFLLTLLLGIAKFQRLEEIQFVGFMQMYRL